MITTAVAATALLVAYALARPLDHDEHQFVASGALLARNGLWPYRDYPYHHLPYLTFAYALLFMMTDHLLAAARTFSALFAVGCLALIFAAVHSSHAYLRALPRFGLAAAFAVVLAVNPLFLYATGRAWNHDVSVFFALSSFLLFARATRTSSSIYRWAGAALGVAVGLRSSFLLLVPGFAIALLLEARRSDRREALSRATAFGTGFVFAVIPLVALFAIAPEGFLHGNLRYNLSLNPAYRLAGGYESTMSFGGKLRYLVFDVLTLKRNAALCVVTALAYAAAFGRSGRRCAREMQILAVLLPFLLLAALSATPSWYQYFYAPIPFLLLAISYALADRNALRWRRVMLGATAVLLAGSVLALRHYGQMLTYSPRRWTAICIHRVGVEIGTLARNGPVLTITPILPLEGGAAIYPELATGPFAWRTAYLVPPPERARIHVAGPQEIGSLTKNRRPSAVLTGVEEGEDARLEAELIRVARADGLYEAHLPGDVTLWIDYDPGKQLLHDLQCNLHG